MKNTLYDSDILSLASNIPLIGRLEQADASVRKAAKLCGSWHESDLSLQDGHVCAYRQRLKACALGQASAAILGEKILQSPIEEVLQAHRDLETMLKQKTAPPRGRFQKLSLLKPVCEYPQRYASTLLAFATASAAIIQALRKQ